MFTTLGNEGTAYTYRNGLTIVIKWGPGDPCEMQNSRFDPRVGENWESRSAAVAVFSNLGEVVTAQFVDSEKVSEAGYAGWLEADEVAEIIARVVAFGAVLPSSSSPALPLRPTA